MAWYYDIADDNSEMDIYEADPEFTGRIETLTNDGSGFDIPGDVKTVMRETWMVEANMGSSPVLTVRAGHILMDMAAGDIREGVP